MALTHHTPVPKAAPEKVVTGFNAEFLSVMQMMIKMEVRNYMNGGSDGLRAVVNQMD
ncbi:hypothetical protein Hanom_Chr13g01220051 [Helianthus anomalus]